VHRNTNERGIFIIAEEVPFIEIFMNRMKTAIDFLNLGLKGKFMDGIEFFSPNCKTHNPYFAGNIESLIQSMDNANKEGKGQYPNAEFRVKQAVEQGDLVAVHTELLSNKTNPGQGGLRQVHLFLFKNEKIVEYWDITQQITSNMPNAAGAF